MKRIAFLAALVLPLSCGNPSFTSADIVTGLIDYWPLDETSGNIAHDVVGGNNVTLSGFPDNQPTWTPGIIGGSLNFNNPSDYAVTNSPISENQYTIDFWLKSNGPGRINPRLVGPRDGINAWDVINSQANKGVGFYYNQGTNLIQDPTPPAQGVWENYAVTVDLVGDTAAVYRDGVQVAEGAFTDHVPLDTWVFGHNQDPSNANDALNGQLDEIRIYDRVLSAADIAQLAPEPSGFVLAVVGFLAAVGWRLNRRRSRCA